MTEIGRQPWTVFGLLTIEDSVSPNVTGGQVLFSLISFTTIYLILLLVLIYLVRPDSTQRSVMHGYRRNRERSIHINKEAVKLSLNDLWFLLIAVLFTGFFFLEGFDFGVGMATRSWRKE